MKFNVLKFLFNEELTKEQSSVINLIEDLCKQSSTQFMHSIKNNEYLLINRNKQITVIVSLDKLLIANHSYYFYHTFPIYCNEKIIRMISEYNEKRCEDLLIQLEVNRNTLINTLLTPESILEYSLESSLK